MEPRISIIIPTRNEEKVLEGTLRRYRRAKRRHRLEIIVSDGRSTDKTVRIARKYADRVVLAKGRQNIAIGRNAGARAARGEYLFITDADVTIPDIDRFFARIPEAFAEERLVAYTARLRIREEEELLRDRFWHFWINLFIRIGIGCGGWLGKGECQVVRASAFRAVGGYDEKLVVGEDNDLFRRLAKRGKVRFLNDLVVRHSPRRFRTEGYVKVLLVYLREGLSLLFRGRSYLTEWRVTR